MRDLWTELRPSYPLNPTTTAPPELVRVSFGKKTLSHKGNCHTPAIPLPGDAPTQSVTGGTAGARTEPVVGPSDELAVQLDEQRLEGERRRDVELLEAAPGL